MACGARIAVRHCERPAGIGPQEVQERHTNDVDGTDAAVVLEVANASSDWPVCVARPEEHAAVQFSQERLKRDTWLQLQATEPQESVVAYFHGTAREIDPRRLLATH